jgi:sulfite reductase beta subunit-like hemoprotein
VRTVTACELAEVCPDAAFDVTPYAEAITRHFLRHPLSSSLPRKFKVAFSGCNIDCAFGAIHDIGLVAQVRDGQRGFKVYAAGGLSTTPQAAITLHEFLPAAEIGRVSEAIVRLFHAMGNRENKHRARLKYVLRKLGEPAFRAKYAELKAQVDAEGAAELHLPDNPKNVPAPAVEPSGGPLPQGYLQWRGACVDQNLLVPWVDRRSLPALFLALREIGLARNGVHTASDVTSCPGAESCNLAVTSSRNVARAISERLELADVSGAASLADTTIKISGCPNSCGQHHIADIGWHGAAKTVNGTTYPMYQLHLGGGVDPGGARFGRQVVKVVAQRVPEAVAVLLKLYETERTEGESTADFYRRVDPKRVVGVLGDIAASPPRPEEQTDIGEQTGFHVAIGAGECAA